MTPHVRLVQSARHARKTIYLVAGFYVAVGFVMALVSAIQGDRLGAFLGFLIISGALAMGLLFRAALHLGLRISAMGESLDELRRHIEQSEDARRIAGAESREVRPTRVAELDLASVGAGDPSVLAAATLDRDVYPRLVASMDDESSARPGTPGDDSLRASDGPAVKSLLRQWRIALREGDLAGCREVLSAMIDTADEESVAPLRAQVAALAERVERTLRDEFALHIRDRDFESAILVGERMITLLPDRPVVTEFLKLRPILERRRNPSVRRPAASGSPR